MPEVTFYPEKIVHYMNLTNPVVQMLEIHHARDLCQMKKNSERLILNPLHIFSRVTTVGQVWRLNMLLRLEYARLDSLASLYSVQCLNSSNCCILFNTSCSIIYITHFRLLYVIVIILKNNT